MCSTEKALRNEGDNLPLTDPIAASGAIDYCGFLSKLKCTTALADGRRRRREYLKRYAQTERGKAVIKAYEQRNKAHRSAYQKMRTALKNGDMTRPKHCEQCGASGKIDGHHDDYALPLVVRWLCRACHKTWHRKNGKARNG